MRLWSLQWYWKACQDTLTHLCSSQQQVDILRIQNWTPQLRGMLKHRDHSSSDDIMKSTSSFSKAMKNESCNGQDVSCFTCEGKGHLTKICSNNYNKGQKPWCNYCKNTTHKRELCFYKQTDTLKKVADVVESSFTFKTDEYYPQELLKTLETWRNLEITTKHSNQRTIM